MTMIWMRFPKIIFILLLSIALQGCMSNIKLAPTFWEDKTSTTAVCLTPHPVEGHIFRDVEGGFLPGYIAVIDSWDERLTAFVQKFDNTEFDRIKMIFSNEFAKRGIQIKLADDKVCSSLLTKLHDNKNSKSEALNSLRKQTSADYLLVFQIPAGGWGIMQVGYPLFTKYYSELTMYGYLLDLHDGEMKWRYIWSRSTKHRVRIFDDWNQPPDYPNVAKAMHEVIRIRTNELYDSFFNEQ